MSMEHSGGLVADINMRVELRQLAARASRLHNDSLAAILNVAIRSLDQRIADPANYVESEPPPPNRGLICRNIRIGGKRTSVKLEGEFWSALAHLAAETGCSIDDLCETARRRHPHGGLTSAIRVFLLDSRAPAVTRRAAAPRIQGHDTRTQGRTIKAIPSRDKNLTS